MADKKVKCRRCTCYKIRLFGKWGYQLKQVDSAETNNMKAIKLPLTVYLILTCISSVTLAINNQVYFTMASPFNIYLRIHKKLYFYFKADANEPFQPTPPANDIEQLLKPKAQLVLFERIGHLAANVALGHIAVPIDLSRMRSAVHKVCSHVAEVMEDMKTRQGGNRMDRNAFNYAALLEDRCVNLKSAQIKYNNLWFSPEPEVIKPANLMDWDSLYQSEISARTENTPDSTETTTTENYTVDPNMYTEGKWELPRSGTRLMPPINEQRVLNREKRQIILAGIGLGIAAIAGISAMASNVYSSNQLRKFSTQLHNNKASTIAILKEHEGKLSLTARGMHVLEQATKNIALKLIKTGYRVNELSQEQILETLVANLEAELWRLELGFADLQRHRLHPSFLDPMGLDKGLSRLRKLMGKQGYSCAISNIHDLFSMDVSHIVYQNQTMLILIHIPFFKAQSIMDLYSISADFPIILGHLESVMGKTEDAINKTGKGEQRIIPHLDKTVLSIDSSHTTYKEMSHRELNLCTQVLNTRLCPQDSIVDRRVGSACLPSLFMQKNEGAAKNCK